MRGRPRAVFLSERQVGMASARTRAPAHPKPAPRPKPGTHDTYHLCRIACVLLLPAPACCKRVQLPGAGVGSRARGGVWLTITRYDAHDACFLLLTHRTAQPVNHPNLAGSERWESPLQPPVLATSAFQGGKEVRQKWTAFGDADYSEELRESKGVVLRPPD